MSIASRAIRELGPLRAYLPPAMTPVRAVLFDAFGTLFRPRAPIRVQYAQVAEAYGLLVRPDEIQAGFRAAWKEVSARHPLYGKHSDPPLHYEDWWGLIIERTFQKAGLADSGACECRCLRIADCCFRTSWHTI